MKEKLLFPLIVLLLIAQIGHLAYTIMQPRYAQVNPIKGELIKSELLSSQNASIRGKILKIEGKKMSVENEKKVQGEVEIGRIVLLNEPTKQGNQISIASTSAQISNIRTNKDATINLSLVDDKYIVTSVTYR